MGIEKSSPSVEARIGPSHMIDATNYPRVAIVSANPIRGDQSNGILMRSLFRSWPAAQLSQVYFPVAIAHLPDRTVCGEYRMVFPWGRVRRIQGLQDHELGEFREAAAKNPASGSNPYVSRTVGWVRRQTWLMKYLRVGLEVWGANALGGILERQLRELKPDCVYALIGNSWQTKIVTLACERLGIPLFVHVTDDFVTSLYRDLPFSRRLQSSSEQWFRRAVRLSAGRAAISPVMAEAFHERYGGDWSWFTTLTDSDVYDPLCRHDDGKVQLVYSGNLELERWRMLRELAQCLKTLRAEQQVDVRLAIYAPTNQLEAYASALTVDGVTELKGWVSPEQLPQVFHSADILVHVESFAPAIADYTRLSFSTKLSQYMMAGRAILAFGPAELGSIQMVLRAKAGIAICSDDSATLRSDLMPLLTSNSLRHSYADNGRDWANRWCESRSGRERFRAEIAAAAARPTSKLASLAAH